MGDGPQLVIDGDADGLEAALGRVLLFPQGLGRHGAADEIHQLQGRFDGLFRPFSFYGGRDQRGISFFSVFKQNPAQLLPGPGIDHVIGRQPVVPVHAHIQRRIGHIGKAAAAVIQLGGRYAQVKEHAVDFFQPLGVQNGCQVGKIIMHQGHPVETGCQTPAGGFQRHRVPVHADQAAGGQPSGNLQGMTGAAQSTVQIDSVRLDVQGLDAFVQQHGLMYKFHQKSSSSMTAARDSGVSVSASRAS